MSVFHAVPTCYTTPTSVGTWIPTECKCHIFVTWIFRTSNLSYNVGTTFFFSIQSTLCKKTCSCFCAWREEVEVCEGEKQTEKRQRDLASVTPGQTSPSGRQERLTVGCTVSNQRPLSGLLDTVTLLTAGTVLYVCEYECVCLCKDQGSEFILFRKCLLPPFISHVEFLITYLISVQLSLRKDTQVCVHVCTRCLVDTVSAKVQGCLSHNFFSS